MMCSKRTAASSRDRKKETIKEIKKKKKVKGKEDRKRKTKITGDKRE
jgi:hypothetical protein